NKLFFFVDGEQKSQRHGIPFTGLVPTDAMRAGDFTANEFGATNPLLVNPNVGPTANFQCDAAGNAMPVAADGSQPAGTPCNKIPAGLFNPIAQQMMALYPEPNASNAQLDYNYVNAPVRKLDETKFDIRLDNNFSDKDRIFARFSYDQAV